MQLVIHTQPDWPKLAWVAGTSADARTLCVQCGPMVEQSQDWCVEAVWAGDFAEGDFDRTELVFGSGVRVRDGEAVFVSSGSRYDRLWHSQRGGRTWVSNSLPAILAAMDDGLVESHAYLPALRSVCRGLKGAERTIPTHRGELHLTWLGNLRLGPGGLRDVAKPDSTGDGFADFAAYRRFMEETAGALGRNLADTARQHRVAPLTTISTGYDSCVAAVLGRHMGCTRSVTIRESSSLWRGSDSGADVARFLGLDCREYPLRAASYPHEDALWAMSGVPMELNWAQFDYPQPLCVFLTGCHGDKVWDRWGHDMECLWSSPSLAGTGICEWRLIQGVLHCPVPVWGLRRLEEIRAISNSPEMAAWALDNGYDRPIARRLVEEAGVPRTAFGRRKRNTQIASYFAWPVSPEARESFAAYLRERGLAAPTPREVCRHRRRATVRALLNRNLLGRLGLRVPAGKASYRAQQAMLFAWANHALGERYRQTIRDPFTVDAGA